MSTPWVSSMSSFGRRTVGRRLRDADSLSGAPVRDGCWSRKDRSSLEFDADGQLTASRDANGTQSRSTSDRLSDDLCAKDIWLIHERRIVVQLRDGKVVSATLHTPDGDRTVSYGCDATSCTVTTNVGAPSQNTTVYGYRAGRIASVCVPDAVGPNNAAAIWTITGVPGESLTLENTTGADTPTMRREVTWGADASATTTLAERARKPSVGTRST